MTLLNFGAKPTPLSFAAAGAFTLVALVALAYSVAVYLYRSRGVRERRVIRYHDAVGPTALCAALLFGVALNFAFEGRDRQLW